MNKFTQTISGLSSANMRLDKYIADELTLFSRSQIKQRITEVLINGKQVKLSKKIQPKDRLEIHFIDPPPTDMEPEKIELSILFENDDVIVINKPQGLVVHPGCGNARHTLVNALIYYCKQIKENFEETDIRPGIVHRLDKDTSGVLIVAKNIFAHNYLSAQFAKSKAKKKYLAIVKGQPPEQFDTIDTHIKRDINNRKKFKACESGGKRSITSYTLIQSKGNYSLVLLQPKTGRTHQLRVHLKHIQCPVVGDPLYSRNDKNFPDATLMLHAYTLKIQLPRQVEKSEFTAPLPTHFTSLMKEIGFSIDETTVSR
ncbi:MAG: RluA family pseudouridine synthase [Spirochaetales bacterium]|nr:RluA family pseudouridine synthase [Spirochaetales bacterium]